MYFSKSSLVTYVLTVLPALSTSATVPEDSPDTASQDVVDPFKLYTISAPNITASFIPYGARLTSLLVSDKDGQEQDVVLGYDEPEQYVTDTVTNHTYMGPIVGRYANRIRKGKFEIDGKSHHISLNNNGNSLHGGNVGYDQYNWTVTSYTKSSITFTLLDEAFGGFPGDVVTHATYSVGSSKNADTGKTFTKLNAKLVSVALNKKTPIMLAHHIYWNLNAFKAPDVLDDTTLKMPLSSKYIEVDGKLIPTGEIGNVADSPNGVLDFTKGKLIGENRDDLEGICGSNCTGYDNCWVVDREADKADWSSSPDPMKHVLSMSSSTTGISLDVATNQRAIQIYTCNNQDGSIPVKPSQVKRNKGDAEAVDVINKHGCVVIETEGYIDAINHPEWEQDKYQIFSDKTGPAVNWASYRFGTI